MTEDLRPGMLIERFIEGMWFKAKIISIIQNHVNIQYIDDNNIEEDVNYNDIRIYRSNGYDSNNTTDNNENNNSKSINKLPRPLQGLIDDDYEIRLSHKPKVTVHGLSEDVEEVIILNGAENKLAAGGGIRALRYLKS